MDYSTDYNEAKAVCTVRVWGEHRRPHDSRKLQKVARELRVEHGCSRFLFDMRETRIVSDTISTYQAAAAPAAYGMKPGDYRVALVYADGMDDHKFLENVLVNMGYTLRVFGDIDEAVGWLTEAP
jgi:hypothetical protein